MSSSKNSDLVNSHVKVYQTLDAAGGRNTMHRVLQGVSQSKSLMVLCGSGISVNAGLSTFQDLAVGSERVPSTTVTWKRFISEFAVPNPTTTQIKVINKAMTAYRVQARQAQLTAFHQFLHRKMDSGDCSTCITQNFDGLETRDRSDLQPRVVMLHGNNNILACSAPQCSKLRGTEVQSYDARFLQGETILCPKCREAADENPRARIMPKPLRANVLLDGTIDPNVQWELLATEATDVDTLVIAGASLSSKEIYCMVDELAQLVHQNEGVVVFINNSNIMTTRLAHIIDFYLQIDVQACAETLLGMIENHSDETAQDIWCEFSEPELPSAMLPAAEPCMERMCCQCCLALPEVLLKCTSCERDYCYETPMEPLGAMCTALHFFVPLSPEITLDQSIQAFQCYECFDHSQEAIYPHLARQGRYFFDLPAESPRLLLIVFYLSQFYPDAEHLMMAMVNSWAMQSWECCYWPIPLHSLSSEPDPKRVSPWPVGSYFACVVYITHGVSENFQINDTLGVAPHEFLDKTILPIQEAIRGAKLAVSFVLACGKLYENPRNVAAIEWWINQSGNFHSLVGTLNRRMSPAYMVDLLCQVVIDLLGYSTWKWELLIDLWLRNTLANGHTDLIFFARQEEPRAFYFSPFQTRPLGIPLPPILSSCPCQPEERPNRRKIWKVSHTGKPQKSLSTIMIIVKCSACKTVWHLNKPSLDGVLWRCGGLYASVVKYFA